MKPKRESITKTIAIKQRVSLSSPVAAAIPCRFYFNGLTNRASSSRLSPARRVFHYGIARSCVSSMCIALTFVGHLQVQSPESVVFRSSRFFHVAHFSEEQLNQHGHSRMCLLCT